MNELESKLEYIVSNEEIEDASHGLCHAKRVWKLCLQIVEIEKVEVNLPVLLASAYLHDIVTVPKNHPDRKRASALSAEKADAILRKLKFSDEDILSAKHAILTHSFSAGILPETIEAKILQDADRMEAIGAIGVARCFYTAGLIGSGLFHSKDPDAVNRQLDDKSYALDHFKVKLFKLPEMMQTTGGRQLATKKVSYMKSFVEQMLRELSCS